MIEEPSVFQNDEYYNLNEAASYLGIHATSIKNWIRHGIISPVMASGKLFFSKSHIQQLKKDLENGSIKRLNQRANKSKASKSFIPEISGESKEMILQIRKISEHITNNKLNLSRSLLYLTLNLLCTKKLINIKQDAALPEILFSENHSIKTEMLNWLSSFNSSSFNVQYKDLLQMEIPVHEDILGLVYQSVQVVGSKSRSGSYYTPGKIIKEMVESHITPGYKVLDPCCGTGRFLLSFAEKINNPDLIFGFDIDELAVRIARINLLIKYLPLQFNPQIYKYNSLSGLPEIFNCSFDLIATNPPWGVHFSESEQQRLIQLFPEITSLESFSFFIIKSLQLLRPHGILSVIVPEAILMVNTHKDIKNILIQKYDIIAIHHLGRVFKNVLSKVIRLDISKHRSEGHNIKIINKHGTSSISQSNFRGKFRNNSFHVNAEDQKIINKAYSINHLTLKGQAEWALGVVTGDNKKFLTSESMEGFEAIFTGKEVNKYKLSEPVLFIKFSPELFQQVAPISKYRAKEKLIYKFISKYLVFAYDDQKSLTLNSANILIPQIPDYPIKTILALFNSAMYQFIFQKRFSSIKILKSHLENLPLPVLKNEEHAFITHSIDNIIKSGNGQNELDNYIFRIFNLSSDEINYIQTQL